LREMGPAATQNQAKRNIVRAIDAVAERLGNTRSVCRKYYVHPALVHAYLQGLVAGPSAIEIPEQNRRRSATPALRRDEVAILQFLQEVL
jgi:DNA topoisomerase-1